MPASSFVDLYYMHDARNNFDAMRPAPVCLDANQAVGQCQPIHISTNCYYGYHEPKTSGFVQVDNDCEMMEAAPVQASAAAAPPANTARKRSAPDDECPQTKRLREEVQREREPESKENMRLEETPEDLMESLLWNTHGGSMFHLVQCL
ncbi:uncharacterized protein LOC105385225 isoform X1 [Plutella xylostella]|uniref:uncharacterized protein LOC105385225 isoform X1 n=1 Tax=Plutella xylostella TaxID=51655 RepID=UPI0005D0C24B|nr:uncharacterized protein LOC105385225 isoform X1 [Plutella xylostella]